MKRLWLGIALMALLLGLGVFTDIVMDRLHTPLAQELTQASQAALSQNWEQAESLYTDARGRWEAQWNISACVADHGPMEEIDSLFSQLEIYAQTKDSVRFAACCAGLSRLTQAMGEAHSLSWRNLL